MRTDLVRPWAFDPRPVEAQIRSGRHQICSLKLPKKNGFLLPPQPPSLLSILPKPGTVTPNNANVIRSSGFSLSPRGPTFHFLAKRCFRIDEFLTGVDHDDPNVSDTLEDAFDLRQML
jgi:hypothetical protein